MAISLEQFVQHLTDSGLMSAHEVSAFRDSLPPEKRPKDPQGLARELVHAKTLTKYQAAAIYQGKVKGLVFGEYTVLDKIGAGGMGEVLKARHRTMERVVALKVLPAKAMDSPEAVKRFHREVRAAAKLMHPNIVTAHDAGQHGGLHFLVMEYVNGVDLSELVKEQGPLPVGQAVDYIVQAARGLDYAHKRGVIHRDIKPSNLLLDDEGTVKILDMGLARIEGGVGDKDAGADLTSTGQIMGTCDYMAPEQAEDTHAADARADVYSLGCTLYRLITGKPPYTGNTVMKKLLAHRDQPIPSLQQSRSDVPDALQAVYERMMAKEPDDRLQTMTDVIAELESVPGVADSSATSSATEPPEPELAAFLQDITAGKTTAKQKTATKPKAEPVIEEETIDRQPEQETDTSLNVVAEAPPADAAAGERTVAPSARKRPFHKALSHRTRMLVLIAAGVAVSLIGLIVLGVVMTIQTSYGTVIVATEDENVQVAVSQGSELIEIIDAKKQWRVELKTGDYTIELKKGGDKFQLDKQSITITRGEEVRVRVTIKPRTAKRGSPPPLAIAPFGADQAKKHQTAWADYLGVPVEREIDLPGGVKLTMVLIPPGEFLMGSTAEEQARFLEEAKAANDKWVVDRVPSEGPQHRVRISRPFYLGKYEVTQAQWQAVMGNNPSAFNDPMKPVEKVSWDDIQPFLAKLNMASVREEMKFVLPTEAQWEYACRAGTASAYYFGDDVAMLGEYEWFKDNSGGNTHPVGKKRANGWGLYDMQGNVLEWCADWFARDYYGQSPLEDPGLEPRSYKATRVNRGGAWGNPSGRFRSAGRDNNSPSFRTYLLGFRLACKIPGKSDAKTVMPAASSSKPLPEWQLPSDAPKPAIAPFNAKQAKQHQQAWADYLGLPVERDFDLPGGEKLTMVLIPPGEFMMGSTDEERASFLEQAKAANDQWGPEYIPCEGPQHRVRITRPFYLGKYEVTQGQWEAVTGNNPSQFKDPMNPVEKASWEDIQPFLAKLNTASVREEMKFVLPTEAQSEYACRAGTATAYCFGSDAAMLVEYGWFRNNSGGKTHPVGKKKANSWGLYDMHGNVWEWCADWYDAAYYKDSPSEDPAGPATGSFRVGRGGSWSSDPWYCRSAFRRKIPPDDRYNFLGFRLACEIPYSPKSKPAEPAASSSKPLPEWQLPSDAPKPAIAPFDAKQAKQHQQAWADYLGVPVEMTNSIGMKFMLIPPGEFDMGSTREEIDQLLEEARQRDADDWYIKHVPAEGPRHRVKITRPFYLGVHEVTQQQYEQVVGENPSTYCSSGNRSESVRGLDTGRFPVESVSWKDAVQFFRKLEELPEEKTAGRVYRLPAEAQWEYACRAGTATRWSFGNAPTRVGDYAWWEGNSGDTTHLAGQKKPNAWGLHDMHGNVWEWCADWFGEDYYRQSPPNDPVGPASGKERVLRGGSFDSKHPDGSRSAFRHQASPDRRGNQTYGFRVRCEIPATSPTAATGAATDLNVDFEGETYPPGWTTTGDAFGAGPTGRDQMSWKGAKKMAIGGQRAANSAIGSGDNDKADARTGTLTSPPFVITGKTIGFLLAGGEFPGTACINLIVDGKVVCSTTGKNDNKMKKHQWDVSELLGKSARIEIVDKEVGEWGHIVVDDIAMSSKDQ